MLRTAVVGCGRRGTEHAQAILDVENIRLAGVADSDPAALRQATATLGVPGFASLDALLETHPDILVLATPPGARLDLVARAVRSGVRALLLEKPLALSLVEADRLLEACAGVVVAVGHHWRHTEDMQAFKAALDVGAIGDVEFFRAVSYGNLLDQGSHLLDAVRWLAGGARVEWAMSQADDDPTRVGRFLGPDRSWWTDPAHPAPMWMTHTLQLTGGIRVALETGLLCPRTPPAVDDWHLRKIVAVGSKGMAECRPGHYFRLSGSGLVEGGPDSLVRATRALHEDLRDALLAGRRPLCDAHDARHTLEGLALCLASAGQHRLAAGPLSGVEDAASPLRFSVLIPLVEHRGLTEACLDAWVRGQQFGRERFEVIVAADGTEPALERVVAGRLGPHDRLLRLPGVNRSGLYDGAARAARGEFLVFTEMHCIAEPEFLAELDRYFAVHDHAGACCRSIGVALDAVARIDERLFEEGFREFRREGDWRKFNVHAVALRRAVYHEAGGLDPAFDIFAEMVLSARLRDGGHRLGYAAAPAVRHYYRGSVRDLVDTAIPRVRGELAYRAAHPGPDRLGFTFLEPLDLGIPGQGSDLFPVVFRALARDFFRRGLWRGDFSTLGPLAATLPGWSNWWRRTALRWSARVAAFRCLLWRFSERRLERALRDLWDRTLRLTRFHWLTEEYAGPPLSSLTAADLPEQDLLGVYLPATYQGVDFRWTGPVAAMRLWLAPGDCELAIDTGGLRGDLSGLTRFFFNARPLPASAVRWDDGVFRLTLRGEQFERRRWQALVVVCTPMRPWELGSADRRELGVPVVRIEATPMKAVQSRAA